MKNYLRPVMTMILAVVLLGLMLFCTSCGKSEEQDWAKKEEQILAIMDDDIDREKLDKLLQIRPGWTDEQIMKTIGEPDRAGSGSLTFWYALSDTASAYIRCYHDPSNDDKSWTVTDLRFSNAALGKEVTCIENFKFVPAE